jgi:hypothetical protein
MSQLSRKDFLELGTVTAASLAAGGKSAPEASPRSAGR